MCHLCISDRQHSVMLMTDPLTAWFIQSRVTDDIIWYLTVLPTCVLLGVTDLQARHKVHTCSVSSSTYDDQGPSANTTTNQNHNTNQKNLKYKSAYLYLHFCSAVTLRRKMTRKVRPGPHGSCSAPIIHFFLPSLGRKHHPAEATMAKKLLKLWLFDGREDPEEGEMPEGTI